MENPWSVDRLIRSMRTRGYLPQSTALTDAQILQQLTDEAALYVPALLKSIREEYLNATLDVDVTVGEETRIPERACGAALRNIEWLDGTRPRPLNRIEPERQYAYPETGEPVGYVFRGSHLTVVPSKAGTVRLTYQQRPGQLVTLDVCCRVNGPFTTSDDVVTVASMPQGFTDGISEAGEEDYPFVVDFIRGAPNFEPIALDVEVDGIEGDEDSGSITFVDDIPVALEPNDFICIAGQTCLPPFPTEVHQLLALRTAFVLSDGAGSNRAPALKAQLEGADGKGGLRAEVIRLLSPRSDSNARPIIRKSSPARRWWW